MTEVGDEFEYFLYSCHGEYLENPAQLRCRLPWHELEEIKFLGRKWCKPDRHEEQLKVMYGQWREPDPEHQYTNSGAVVERTPWVIHMDWDLG